MSLTVGVLGGMGPAATVDFLARLVRLTPATAEADHLRVLMDINPHVPDRNRAAAGLGPSPGPALGAMAEGLMRQGAQLLCMPCNAAHGWVADIRAAAPDLPFVSIIDAAARAAAGAGRPGLLAVDGTRAAGLYAAAMPDAVLLDPDDQARFMAAVRRIKAAGPDTESRAEMAHCARRLAEAGAQVIVAACTEVPLALSAADTPLPLIDATEALATEVVNRATGG